MYRDSTCLKKLIIFIVVISFMANQCVYAASYRSQTLAPQSIFQKEKRGLKGTPEEEREAREFLAENIDIDKLDEHFETIIKLYGYKPFQNLLILAGKEGKYVFGLGLPTVKTLIRDRESLIKIGNDLVEISKSSKSVGKVRSVDKKLLFVSLKKTISEEGLRRHWPDILELIKATGENSPYVLEYGLPLVSTLITDKKSKIAIFKDLIEINKAAGKNSVYLFARALPSLRKTFTEEELREYWPGIVEIAKAAGEDSRVVFEYGLPAVKTLITDRGSLIKIGNDLLEISKPVSGRRDLLLEEINKFVRDFSEEELIKYWPDIIEMSKAVGLSTIDFLFQQYFYLRRTFTKEEIFEYWPYIVELYKIAGSDEKGLPSLKETFTEDELREYWPGIVEIGKAAGKKGKYVFGYGLPSVKPLITDKESLINIGNDLVEMSKTAGEDTRVVFEYGLPAVKTLINDRKSLKKIGNDLSEISQICTGAQDRIFKELSRLDPLIEKYPSSWNILIKPIIHNQTVAAGLCFAQIVRLYQMKAIHSEEDLIFVRELVENNGMRAYDILKKFIVAGIEQKIIKKPISKEKILINDFLSVCPYPIIDIYLAYKLTPKGLMNNYLSYYLYPIIYIYHKYKYKNRPRNLKELVKKCELIHEKIHSGDVESVENDPLFSPLLMHVFSPAVTTQRDQVMNLFKQRQDHLSHTRKVPSKLQNVEFELSTGRYVLKDPTKPLDETPWNSILRVIKEVNMEEDITMNDDDITDLGKEIIYSWKDAKLIDEKDEINKKLYRYLRCSQGQKLPDTLGTIQNIMTVKQFVGDTMRDLVEECIYRYKNENPKEYKHIINRMLLTKIENPMIAAKKVLGVIKRYENQPDKAKEITGRILKISDQEQMNILWDEIKYKRDAESIRDVFKELTLSAVEGKECDLIAKYLQGEEYKAMQGEVSSKYEFQEAIGKTKLRTVVSKRKAHGVVGLNMGVCVAPDEKLWNNPNFMNVIIFDDNNVAQGGMHVMIIEDEGKKYLTLPGINPTIGLLSQVPADDIYDKLIEYAHALAEELKCEGVFIPTQADIYSNRSEIQRVVSGKNYKDIKLSKKYLFSDLINPDNPYTIQKCYVVPRPIKTFIPSLDQDINSAKLLDKAA